MEGSSKLKIPKSKFNQIQHEGNGPSNYNEKTEFRAQIKKAAKFNYVEEENFQEAYNKIGNAFKKAGEIPYEVEQLFTTSQSVDLSTDKQADFWVRIIALKNFREKEGRFPVS